MQQPNLMDTFYYHDPFEEHRICVDCKMPIFNGKFTYHDYIRTQCRDCEKRSLYAENHSLSVLHMFQTQSPSEETLEMLNVKETP